MPAPAWPWRLKLKATALDTMAAAIGPAAYRKNGAPRREVLLGEGTADDASRLIRGKQNPSDGSFATSTKRMQEAAQLTDPWEAAKLIWDFVPNEHSATEAAA